MTGALMRLAMASAAADFLIVLNMCFLFISRNGLLDVRQW